MDLFTDARKHEAAEVEMDPATAQREDDRGIDVVQDVRMVGAAPPELRSA